MVSIQLAGQVLAVVVVVVALGVMLAGVLCVFGSCRAMKIKWLLAGERQDEVVLRE